MVALFVEVFRKLFNSSDQEETIKKIKRRMKVRRMKRTLAVNEDTVTKKEV